MHCTPNTKYANCGKGLYTRLVFCGGLPLGALAERVRLGQEMAVAFANPTNDQTGEGSCDVMLASTLSPELTTANTQMSLLGM